MIMTLINNLIFYLIYASAIKEIKRSFQILQKKFLDSFKLNQQQILLKI